MDYDSMELTHQPTSLGGQRMASIEEHAVKHEEPKAEEPKHEEPKAEEPKKNLDNMKKWKYTLITTVIFLIIANPYTYILVNYLFKCCLGKRVVIASATGCPTMIGLILHAVVFTLLLRWVMDWKI
jgi:hypothetical protein